MLMSQGIEALYDTVEVLLQGKYSKYLVKIQ